MSGLLYQSDVLMYDRQTESLWSQLGMESVAGPLAGTPLEWMPSRQMTWAEWKKTYPLKKLAKKTMLDDQVGGIAETLQYSPRAQLVTVRQQSTGKDVPVVSAYWFAWQAFYPDTNLFP